VRNAVRDERFTQRGHPGTDLFAGRHRKVLSFPHIFLHEWIVDRDLGLLEYIERVLSKLPLVSNYPSGLKTMGAASPPSSTNPLKQAPSRHGLLIYARHFF
jgi:hypothetical protein